MGLFQEITSAIQKANMLPLPHTEKASPPYSQLIRPSNDNQALLPNESTEDYQGLYSLSSSVYKAVGVISSNIAQLPIKIISDNTPNENLADNPEFSLFKTYNQYHTHYEFWEQSIGYLELTGECPWLLKKDNLGKIIEIYPLRPDMITVVPANEVIVSHYEYNVRGNTIKIPAEEIMFLKYFNPLSHYRGLSPISAAKSEVILDLHAVTSVKSQFKRGAQPSGMVSTDQDMSDADWKRTQEYLKGQYSGSDNAGKIMFLSHGLRWTQMSLNAQDMQFMEQRQWTKDSISEVFGVPPIFLMQFKEASVLANADVQYKLLWENIKPKLVKLEQIINSFMMPNISSSANLKFKFDLANVSPLQPDFDKRAQRYKVGFAIGAVTPNDYLEAVLEKERVDDPAMDLHYIPANVIPLDQSASGSGGEGEKPPEEAPQDALENIEEHIARLEGKTEMEQLSDGFSSFKKNYALKRSETEIIQQGKSLDRIIDRVSKSMKKDVVKIFTKMKKEVLKNVEELKLYEPKKMVKVTEIELFRLLQFIKLFQEAGGKNIMLGVKLAGADMAEKLGYGNFDVHDSSIEEFVNQRSVEYAEMVTGTLASELDGLVRSGLADGLSIGEISANLTGFFDNADFRAERIARTEAVRASNKGRIVSMTQGGHKYHMWVSQRDGKVRVEHSNLDGEVVTVGEQFPVPNSYNGDAEYPSDINERCFTIPVAKPRV